MGTAPASQVRIERPLTRQSLAAALLHRAPPDTSSHPLAASAPAAVPDIAPEPLIGARRHVLLVDDSEVNQLIGVAALRRLGFEVDIAASGEAALTALQTRDYALVLMDIHLPGMDGFQTTRMIRDPNSGVRDHAIPVLAMTASLLDEDRVECLAAGMNDFVYKPIRPDELSAGLRPWLRA